MMNFRYMARRRFFVPHVRRGVAELTGDDADHLVRVLRAEVDDIHEISDNSDLYLARITVARKSVVSFEILQKLPVPPLQGRLTLVAALFKFDRFEWLIEKATELGVDEILPFEAVRTEHGLKQASIKRRTRWQRIALEASQQSRRTRLPDVAETVRFQQAVQFSSAVKVLLDENPASPPILNILPHAAPADGAVALLLGPEGGWTEAEQAQALDCGWQAASLGLAILRAETAGIAGLSVIRAWSAR